ncbi:hypothetical protein MJO28_015873 [Puccinia striiformis f. sp. tritici]|uniref:Uncharacterized protein n=1 Tax=Puccinia striiformis f. sp. tritici TaxID=168172 RepID=A0ACC0DRM6_9BASI|nr:hypothetical protein MJO28_015873 [Puccinia striiformis f. sp. tritici]
MDNFSALDRLSSNTLDPKAHQLVHQRNLRHIASFVTVFAKASAQTHLNPLNPNVIAALTKYGCHLVIDKNSELLIDREEEIEPIRVDDSAGHEVEIQMTPAKCRDEIELISY